MQRATKAKFIEKTNSYYKNPRISNFKINKVQFRQPFDVGELLANNE